MDSAKALLELEKFLKEWTKTTAGRRAFLASLPLLVAACSTHSNQRSREGDNTGQVTELTVEDEKKMTAEVLPQMKKEYPASKNPQIQKYVSNLGSQIVHANKLEGNPYNYSFTAVEVPYVNAFALPAGTIFVTTPLLAMAETEAELAGVVGHEVGHVKARHTAERMDFAKREQKKSWLFGITGGLLGGAAGFGLGKLLCPPKDNACLAQATALGAAAGAGGGLLIQKFGFMANSREDEMEADRIGFRTSTVAGFDRNHVGNFYSKLLKMEEERQSNQTPILSSMADALSTHPPSRERVAQMDQLVAEASSIKSGKVNSRDFENVKDIAVEWTKKNPQK